ncbi:cellulose binding domain-containing protein [Winogradskya humida]|uniref:CBM2 domain-containing protein n=1 Tax=Winogradskya humida TaxID=113566 RepID=A0ABQ4A496_9ACTN|nr:cellulose binding domain-containing protein [Actinoplanes humidus]GIE25685.1 hypothetical protein Ahu01nite_087870 [Actinoplanes humidus]
MPVSSSPTPAVTTTTPPPAAVLSARYRTTASWDTGFIGYLQVTNNGDTSVDWAVSVTFAASAGVNITNTWNAQLTGATFTGGALAPGATATFGFSANKQVKGKVAPASCTARGTSCKFG